LLRAWQTRLIARLAVETLGTDLKSAAAAGCVLVTRATRTAGRVVVQKVVEAILFWYIMEMEVLSEIIEQLSTLQDS
jgi:hypothetical protein